MYFGIGFVRISLTALILTTACAKTLENVFTSLAITSPTDVDANKMRRATLRFKITETMDAQKGDTFNLNMPNVWYAYANNIDVTDSSGNSIAKCSSTNSFGETTASSLTCTVKNENLKSASGTVKFDILLSTGGKISPAAISAANAWKLGVNTVTFNNLEATATLSRASPFTAVANSAFEYDEMMIPNGGSQFFYYLANACPNGLTQKQVLTLNLGGSPGNAGDVVDCSNVEVNVGNSFNAWNLPKAGHKFSSDKYSIKCGANKIVVTATSVPKDYNIFINADRVLADGGYFSDSYTDVRVCAGTTSTWQKTKTYNFQQGSNDGSGNIQTKTSTSTTKASSSLTPTKSTSGKTSSQTTSTTTIGTKSTSYTPWTGTVTSTFFTETTTFTGPDGIPTTETVYHVETPQNNKVSTTYTPWTGTVTSTFFTETTTFTGPDGIPTTETVYHVETPQNNKVSTTYTPWTGTVTSTFFTETTTFTGPDGIPTTETVYHAETPKSLYYGNTTFVEYSSTISSFSLSHIKTITSSEPGNDNLITSTQIDIRTGTTKTCPFSYTETPSSGSLAGTPSSGSPAGTPSSGSPAGAPSSGSPAGTPSSGSPAGAPSSGSPAGTPSYGSPAGTPSSGSPAGTPSSGSPAGAPSSGSPAGTPSSGSPAGTPSSGSPAGTPSSGSPAGTPSSGSPAGAPSSGSPAGTPSSGSPARTPSSGSLVGSSRSTSSTLAPSVSPYEGAASNICLNVLLALPLALI
ncbi:hypothetical protein ACU8KH_00973 [Lachancea thermotolerans]